MSKNKKSDRTRSEILDTAWRLIAEEGADISVSKIASAVGLTRQSIYVHFGSRGGLLVALVRRADEREDIWRNFELALGAADAAARLRGCLNAWFDFVPKIHPVATDLIRLKGRDKEAATAWYDRMEELKSFYRARIEDLEKEEKLPPNWTVNTATDFLWTMTSVQNWDLLVRDCGWSQQEAANALTDRALEALISS